MADFKLALDNLLAYEGGYSNNPHDAGGETVFGISRVNQPNWVGWPHLDRAKRSQPNLALLNSALRADDAIMAMVADFYHTRFWHFDPIADQDVANKLLEMEVLFGSTGGVRILQQALTHLGHQLIPDGVLTAQTLQAAETAKGPELMHALRAFCALAHVHHILARPDQITFAEGWLWRATA